MRVLAGTSGFSYKEWKGSFYPEDLAADRMLSLYAERLPAVEINNTFYRMPKPALLESWAAEVLAGLSLRAEGVAADHALQAAEGRGLGGRVLLRRRLDARRPARPGALPAAAESQEGPAAPRGVPRDAPGGPARGVRVPPRLAGSGTTSSRPCGRAARRCAWRTDERARDAARDDGALGLPAPSPAGLRRRGGRRTGPRRCAPQPWSDAYVFFKHEDAGSGPRLAGEFLKYFGPAVTS